MAEVAEEVDISSSVKDIAPSAHIEPLVPRATLKEASSPKEEKTKVYEQRSLDYIAGTQSLLTAIILVLACIVAFSSRLFAVIRFESIIHEFDPWYGKVWILFHPFGEGGRLCVCVLLVCVCVCVC